MASHEGRSSAADRAVGSGVRGRTAKGSYVSKWLNPMLVNVCTTFTTAAARLPARVGRVWTP